MFVRRKRYLLLMITALLAACDGSISDQEERPATVHVEVRPALVRIMGQAQNTTLTAVDSVVLSATGGVTPERQALPFHPEQSRYSFHVRVQRRPIAMVAQMVSDSGVVLFNGVLRREWSGEVVFDELQSVAPFPAVRPESFGIIAPHFGVITLANRGRDLLIWNIETVPAGVSITPMSGTLWENEMTEIRIATTVESLGNRVLELQTNVGSLRLPFFIVRQN
jgi:hypothetical protein